MPDLPEHVILPLRFAHRLVRVAGGDFLDDIGLPRDVTFEQYMARYERYGEQAANQAMRELMAHSPTGDRIRKVGREMFSPEQLVSELVDCIEEARASGSAEGVRALERVLSEVNFDKLKKH